MDALSPTNRRRGPVTPKPDFTLVELLVVIVIIRNLIALFITRHFKSNQVGPDPNLRRQRHSTQRRRPTLRAERHALGDVRHRPESIVLQGRNMHWAPVPGGVLPRGPGFPSIDPPSRCRFVPRRNR